MADFVTEVNKQFKVTPVVLLGTEPGSFDAATPIQWSLAEGAAGTIEANPDGSGTALATLTAEAIDVVVTGIVDANLSPDGVQDLVLTGTVTATAVAPVLGADNGSLAFEPVA